MNELGVICDIKDNKAKVNIGGMVTDFLNVAGAMCNSYAVSFSPLRVGEQVLVLPVRGDLNSGIILRGIYQNAHKPLSMDTNCYNISFEDGTTLLYDSSKSCLSINATNKIEIFCKEAVLNSQNSTVNSPQINLNGNTTIAGAISTSGSGGGSGSFSIKGNLNLNGNLSVSGNISDGKGDLTNHEHSCTCGARAVSR